MAMPKYPGELTDQNIRAIFRGAGDFIARELRCGQFQLHAYAIDGLVAANSASDYVIKPIAEQLSGSSMEELYTDALRGYIYNTVADPCKDLDTVALKLVNGFCVVLFPGAGAIAFEVKTPEKEACLPRRWRIPSRGPRMPSWRPAVPIPVWFGGIFEVPICEFTKRLWAAEASPMFHCSGWQGLPMIHWFNA